jgi:hypothetical protein
MTPFYDTYTTISVDASYNLYSTAVVEGSAAIHPSQYCNTSGTSHRGQVNNQLGTVSRYVFGPWVSPSSYISVANPLETPATPGIDYINTTDSFITCSAVGQIFTGGGILSHTFSIRLSAYIFNGLSSGRCTFVPTCAGKCTSQFTTPLDPTTGLCFLKGPWFQCADLLKDGKCWLYRTICYDKTNPGICTN